MAGGSPQREGAEAFTAPDQVNHRRYEALRAFYVDGLTYARAGERAGYTRWAMVNLVREYRAGKLELFAPPRRPGPPPGLAPAKDRARGRVIELRRDGLSTYEISARLATGRGATGHGGIRHCAAVPVPGHELAGGALPRVPVRFPMYLPGPNRVMIVDEEPRAAVIAQLETLRDALSVANTHLSFVPGWNRRQFRLVGGPKSVDHLGRDPPTASDLIPAFAGPITDLGALFAVNWFAARGDTAPSARSSGSPAWIHPRLQMLAQLLGVLGGEVDLVADSVQPELDSFVGSLAVEIVNQGDEDLLDHLPHFLHTSTEYASTDDHTLSHRKRPIPCNRYVSRPPAHGPAFRSARCGFRRRPCRNVRALDRDEEQSGRRNSQDCGSACHATC